MNYIDVYEKAFTHPTYSQYDEREFKLQYLLDYIKKDIPKTVIDVGSGRGNLLKLIKDNFPSIKLMSVDLNKFHNIDVDFMQINLSLPEDRVRLSSIKYDLVTCFDVLEHLDKFFIEDVLFVFSKIAPISILTIANHSDILDGIELHTIQEDFTYWGALIEKYFDIIYYEERYIIDSKPLLYLVNLKSKTFK